MPHPSVPPFAGNISFNAQHCPMGAFMSFTCGHFGTRGGLGAQIGQPAGQELYIGVKRGDRFSTQPLRCLPFFEGAGTGRGRGEEFLVEQSAGPKEQNGLPHVSAYAAEEITRRYGWATDHWATPDFQLAVYSPFGSLPDPATADARAMRDALAPAVIAEFVVDNRKGQQTLTAAFAIHFETPGVRLTGAGADANGRARQAFQLHDRLGFAAELADPAGEDGLFAFQRWNVIDGLRDANPVHPLGRCAGFGVEVPAGQIRRMRLAMGCYLAGIVTTGLEASYLYARYFSSLSDVLDDVLGGGRFEQRVRESAELDGRLLESGLSADQQFLVAHATRSYYGSTQLLEAAGEPLWVVNEGEYCMMNTLDLAVDQVFWELEQNPWVVRNLLDQFVRRYSFTDQVKVYPSFAAPAAGLMDPDRDPSQTPPAPDAAQLARPYTLAPGGLAFTHDMGIHNNFSAPGQSSYELPNLTGCFSHMTQEQLCNWILTAGCYVAHTRDAEWAQQNAHVLRACLASLHARRDEPGGAMTRDSARCAGGAEITTYDSLDESLGQARSNVYVAVKRWASYAALRMIDELADLGGELTAGAEADLRELPHRLRALAERDPVFPAVMEEGSAGYGSRILAACEALIYPWYWNSCGYPFDGGIAETELLVEVLRDHTLALLRDPQRRNLFKDGGIRLSSTSNNSWMSKIALFQQVAREVLHLDEDPKIDDLLRIADAAHVTWQTDGGGYWACCDQLVNGVARGSRYYPRIITTALWMRRTPRDSATPETPPMLAATV